ncbi:MAG: Gluconolactonase precursor [Planctomycetota bacterium]|jgi:gluconolactonase
MSKLAILALLAAAPLAAQVTFLDPAAEALFAVDAKVETLADDLGFCEGPVWLRSRGELVFSDIPRNRWLRWTARDGVVEWKPSAGANGNAVDRDGRLLSCQHGDRNLVRHEADGSLTVLVFEHAGKRLNSPNDVAVHRDGSIWFTDPTYGLGKREREQAGNFVYRFEPRTGAVRAMLTEGFAQPNGICFSPDHRRVYVADSGAPASKSAPGERVGAFDVRADGTVAAAVFWLEGAADGMRCDAGGNLYTTARDGLRVYAPDGKLLARVALPEIPTNCTFGGADGNELFVTARRHLYRIVMRTKGAELPPPPEPASPSPPPERPIRGPGD